MVIDGLPQLLFLEGMELAMNKMENVLVKIPDINSKKELKEYLKPNYIIEDYLKSDERYGDFQMSIRNILRGCFHIKECREYPITFRFYRKDKETHTLELRRFLYNIYLWRPFCVLDGLYILDSSFILNEEDIPNVNQFINDKLILLFQVLVQLLFLLQGL